MLSTQLHSIDGLDRGIDQVSAEIEARLDPVWDAAQRLMTISGVGPRLRPVAPHRSAWRKVPIASLGTDLPVQTIEAYRVAGRLEP